MKHDFEERKQKRIENAKKQADRNKKEADSLYNNAKEMAGVIPLGQPILVGHHSEKRDRRYRDKIHNTFGKSFEKMKKAEYYAEKAQTIENNDAIFSDDPDALEKLTGKLEALTRLQEFMKAANKYIKKKDKAGFLTLPGASVQRWEQLNTKDCFGGIGFPSYKLTNNNANIRRIKQRIGQLQKVQERQPYDHTINDVRIVENKEANRLQLIFDGKPGPEVRKRLKADGFRWSPAEGAWQRHIGNHALYAAKEIAESLET